MEFLFNFEHISHIFPKFLLLTLNKWILARRERNILRDWDNDNFLAQRKTVLETLAKSGVPVLVTDSSTPSLIHVIYLKCPLYNFLFPLWLCFQKYFLTLYKTKLFFSKRVKAKTERWIAENLKRTYFKLRSGNNVRIIRVISFVELTKPYLQPSELAKKYGNKKCCQLNSIISTILQCFRRFFVALNCGYTGNLTSFPVMNSGIPWELCAFNFV